MRNAIGQQLLSLVRTLAIGPLFAQSIFLLASPILTRLYTPKDFGAVAVFLLAGTGIASIACLKLDNAVIRTNSSLLAVRTASVAAFLSLISAIVCVATGLLASHWFGTYDYILYIVVLGPYIFIGGLYDVFNALALRRHFAAVVTRGRIVLAVSSLVAQIGFGLWGMQAEGFIVGLVIGYLCSVAYLAVTLRINRFRMVSWHRVCDLMNLNRHDWLYGAPSALFSTLHNNLPAVVLAAGAGATIGGYYTLIQRVVFNPVVIITSVLSQSVLPWLSRTREHGSGALLARVCSVLGIATLGVIMAIYPVVEPLFATVFGEQWREAGVYAGLLFLLLPYRVVFDILSVLLISENRQLALFWIRGLTLLLGMLVLFKFTEAAARESFLLFSLVQAICSMLGIYAVSTVLSLALSPLIARMCIGMLSSYLIVVFEKPLRATIGTNTFSLLLVVTGLLIGAASVTRLVISGRAAR